MKNVLITGVSSGLGYALAQSYLEREHRVLGLSRRRPDDLAQRSAFRFVACDLADERQVAPAVGELIRDTPHLQVVILNAGYLSPAGDMSETSLGELQRAMQVHVWANKLLLDVLFASGRQVDRVVAISTGASISGSRGWGAYALSKAALNMLVRLYAKERPETHFAALAPGLIATPMLEKVWQAPADERFAAFERIRAKRGTPETLEPAAAARRVVHAIERLPQLVESGAYADLRELPLG